jgi:hypothetical protein
MEYFDIPFVAELVSSSFGDAYLAAFFKLFLY